MNPVIAITVLIIGLALLSMCAFSRSGEDIDAAERESLNESLDR